MAIVTPRLSRPRSTNESDRLLLALYSRHTERGDLCAMEVEVGHSGRRLDFWAMKPSWSKPNPTGYEIKVSVADFRRDTKWESYLPYCESFYFVSPAGLLRDQLISPAAGLAEVDEAGLVYIVKRAPRKVVAPQQLHEMGQRMLFRYVYRQGELVQPPWTEKQIARLMARTDAAPAVQA